MKPKNKENGFTIVELVVAMVIGSILMIAATMMITSQNSLGQRGRDLVIANAFAEQKIEELRSIGFLGLSDGTTNITSQLPTELNPPRSGSLQISTYSTAIKKVDLSITYSDQGSSRTYSYTTFVGELGVGQY